ncbi:hypothetical protein V6N13_101037 [Hibiscus sabdariffa]
MVFQKRSRVVKEVHVSIVTKVSITMDMRVVLGLIVKETIISNFTVFKDVRASTITVHVAPTVAGCNPPFLRRTRRYMKLSARMKRLVSIRKKKVVVKEMTLLEANDKVVSMAREIKALSGCGVEERKGKTTQIQKEKDELKETFKWKIQGLKGELEKANTSFGNAQLFHK